MASALTVCAVRPSLPQAARRRAASQRLAAPAKRLMQCKAEPEQRQAAEEEQQQQASAPLPPPPSPLTPGQQAFNEQQKNMASQPDALGPIGNALMAALLVALCGASIFFTVGRQFQPDLVALDAEEYAAMMAAAQQGDK